MFTPFVRFLILAICVGLSIAAAAYNITSLLIVSSIVSVVILYGYFKVSSVLLAVRAVLAGNIEMGEKYLAFIKQPEKLSKKNQLYYMFANSMLLRHKDDFDAAIPALTDIVDNKKLAVEYRNIALIALVDMFLVKRNKEQANFYYQKINQSKLNKSLLPTYQKMKEWL